MGEAPHFVKEHWIKEKVNMDHPFKQLPYFIDGPVKLSEYRAIHYYIAKKYKPELLGKTPGDMGKVDMAQNIIHELNFGMRIPCFTQDSHEHVQKVI
jgi:glutathione S-transferase